MAKKSFVQSVMCGKKKLDKIKAMLIVAQAENSTSSQRRECRWYFCRECFAYHTTSKRRVAQELERPLDKGRVGGANPSTATNLC